MKVHYTFLLVCLFIATFKDEVRADIPPLPPPELRKELGPSPAQDAPWFRPMSVAIAGLSLAIALGLAGLGMARHGSFKAPTVLIGTLVFTWSIGLGRNTTPGWPNTKRKRRSRKRSKPNMTTPWQIGGLGALFEDR